MDLTAWLEAEKGRAAALAAHFGKTPAAVSQWKTNGVPVALMKAVRDFTNGAVTLEEMVPEPAPSPAKRETSEAPAMADPVRERQQASVERLERALGMHPRRRRTDKPGAVNRESRPR